MQREDDLFFFFSSVFGVLPSLRHITHILFLFELELELEYGENIKRNIILKAEIPCRAKEKG